jgi:hypothetical protein
MGLSFLAHPLPELVMDWRRETYHCRLVVGKVHRDKPVAKIPPRREIKCCIKRKGNIQKR